MTFLYGALIISVSGNEDFAFSAAVPYSGFHRVALSFAVREALIPAARGTVHAVSLAKAITRKQLLLAAF